MDSPRELLALRREVLVARASFQRLKVARELDALRESLTLPRAAAALVRSPQGRFVLFGILLVVAGRGRLARIVRAAAAAVALAKLAGTLVRAARIEEG